MIIKFTDAIMATSIKLRIAEFKTKMGPVSIDAVDENRLTDEEYVIYRAKISQKNYPSSSKAWSITAKTLFPRNFSVQVK